MRVRRLAPAISTVILALLLTGPVLAVDEIGIFFDPAATQNTTTTSAPNAVVTAYLVLLDPSATADITAWECRLAWYTDGPAPVALQWNLRGDATNYDTPPDFLVGVNTPLPVAAQVVLMELQLLVPDPAAAIALHVQPYPLPSIIDPPDSGYRLQQPIYTTGSGEELVPLTQISGCESYPVAEINGPVPAPTLAVAGPGLAVMPFDHINTVVLPISNSGDGPLAATVALTSYDGLFLEVGGQGPHPGPVPLHLEPGETKEVRVVSIADQGLPTSMSVAACGDVLHITEIRRSSTQQRAIEFSNAELDFGTTLVGTTVRIPVTVLNHSDYATQLAITDDCASFGILGAPLVVPAFGQLEFEAFFTPYEGGTTSCEIGFDTPTDEPTVVLHCLGTGVGGDPSGRAVDFESRPDGTPLVAGERLGAQFCGWGVMFKPSGPTAGTVLAAGDGYTAFGNSPTNAISVGGPGEALRLAFVRPGRSAPTTVERVAFLVGDGDPDTETVEVTVTDQGGATLYHTFVSTVTEPQTIVYVASSPIIAEVTVALAPASLTGAVIDDLRFDDLIAGGALGPGQAPLTTGLLGCAPNPCNPRTVLRYAVPAAGPVRLDVFDVRGRRVPRLVDRIQPAGQHEVTWAGQADDGRAVASGVYLARLRAAGSEDTHRLVLMK
ncbi:MAG: hypothetical protein R3D98_09585 [Candidatus Krumholzibacteriia bacterium]